MCVAGGSEGCFVTRTVGRKTMGISVTLDLGDATARIRVGEEWSKEAGVRCYATDLERRTQWISLIELLFNTGILR
jgi:hypothetical protein